MRRGGLGRAARRFPNWRFAFVTGSLLGAMLLAAGAAFAIHRSWREHERTLRASLDEYARYAARAFGDEVAQASAEIRLRALAAAREDAPAGPGGEVSLEAFAARAGGALDAAGIRHDPWRGFFRFHPLGGEVVGIGAAAGPAVGREIASVVAARLPAPPREAEPGAALVRVRGETVGIAFVRQAGAAGEPPVLGITYSRVLALPVAAERALGRVPLLPPSFISPESRSDPALARSDSVVSLDLLDLDGRLLFRSPLQFGPGIRGESVVDTGADRFVARATLNPAVVKRITRSHRHAESRRLDLLLPLVSTLLAASAIVNLVRERELARARRDFVAGVSHDLRTPLAQIRMFSETLLLRRDRSEEERSRWLGVIHREARRLDDLVENVLLFSRLDGPGQRLAREPTELEELLEEVVEVYAPFAAARGAKLETEARAAPPADVDPRALRLVVANLVDNALKFGPSGQTVTLGLGPGAPGRVRITVTDQGPGVPLADRERLWEPFVRLPHDGGSTPGSGLGLAVVSSVVAHHNGDVWVEDAEGGGARFVAELPASRSATSGSSTG